MGLDIGFENAGFRVKVAADIDKDACRTIRANRPNIPVLEGDLTCFTTAEILRVAGLKIGEATVVLGGPPCQPFSTAGTRKGLTEKRGTVLLEYIRVIEQAKPQYFVFENVKGLTNAALKHMPFYERMKKKEHEIEEESRLGTAFKFVLQELKETGYTLSYKILNAADYGAPQKRERLFIIGSRDGEALSLPEPTHDKPESLTVLTGQRKPWVTLRTALKGLKEKHQKYVDFPPSWGKYMKLIRPGGYWRDLPPNVQKEAMKGAYFSQGGRTGYFRRLSWDLPSPTLVTSPIFKGTCLAHPHYDRPLSVQEYARIQGFPDDWKFVGTLDDCYRMIGEAVPVQLADAVAQAIKEQSKMLQVGHNQNTAKNRRRD
jgi:DNA (cytosine-5)-methyltransferase 1